MAQKKEGINRSPRHLARAFAMLGLYQWLSDKSLRVLDIEPYLPTYVEDNGEALEECGIFPSDYAKANSQMIHDLLVGVISRHEEIEALITKHSNRTSAQVAMVEHAILYIGAYELIANPETPWRVVLNEAIDLAKEFGSGYRFANAVLEKIAREVRPAEVEG